MPGVFLSLASLLTWLLNKVEEFKATHLIISPRLSNCLRLSLSLRSTTDVFLQLNTIPEQISPPLCSS